MVAMLHGKTHGVQSGITLGFLSWVGGGGGGGGGGEGEGGGGGGVGRFLFLGERSWMFFFFIPWRGIDMGEAWFPLGLIPDSQPCWTLHSECLHV